MENIKKLDLSYVENTDSKDNEFENFLWKRAKSVSKEKIKENNTYLSDIKRKLTSSETIKSISDEIEGYMVDYLKFMEFSKDHSKEIGNFMKDNLKELLAKNNDAKDLLMKIEQIAIV